MVDLAKQRRGRRQYDELDENNQEKAHEAMRERRDWQKAVKFTAPGAERKWRARNLVDIHWRLVGAELQPPAETTIESSPASSTTQPLQRKLLSQPRDRRH